MPRYIADSYLYRAVGADIDGACGKCIQSRSDCMCHSFSRMDICGIIEDAPTADVAEAPRWIPVTERLPEKSGEYLVTYHPCYWDDVESEILVGVDTFRGKTTWAKRKYQRVTAWMPLPEPYRKETEDDND